MFVARAPLGRTPHQSMHHLLARREHQRTLVRAGAGSARGWAAPSRHFAGPTSRHPHAGHHVMVLFAGLLAALTAIAVIGLLAPSARAEERFGIGEANFEAGTCKTDVPGTPGECTYASPHEQFFTQAAGHPVYGITSFKLNGKKELLGEAPIGAVKNVRVDIPPGLAADPEALPQCTPEEFETDKCSPTTQVGEDEATAYEAGVNVKITGQVYDLEQPPGVPLEFGIHIEVPLVTNEHILLVGHVSWHHEPQMEAAGLRTGDYHEYFEINNVPFNTPLLKSRLKFDGTAGTFLTLPSECSSTTTSHIRVESYGHAEDPSLPEGTVPEFSEAFTHTPVGVEGCKGVPFEPTITTTPSSAQSDEPDGATIEVKVPQTDNPLAFDSSDVRYAHVTLPDGMTLNPSAANGLEGCSDAQFGRGSANAVACPAGSQIGTVAIETPDLPPGSLTGAVYLGTPEPGAGPESGGEYRIFIDAESSYGVAVRLEGRVVVNPATGQLTTALLENPQLPFSDFIVRLRPGARAPLANPLACGNATTTSIFSPFTTPEDVGTPASMFTVSGCPSSLPFNISQTTRDEPATGGEHSRFTLNLLRADGQQYLAQVQTTLPEGLLGSIASVPHLCDEAQANAGTCPAESEIGSAQAIAGSGPEPYALPAGPVYLTGPYAGAPFGLAIVTPAEHIGPYDYGRIVTRASVVIDPRTTRVTTTASPPLIVGGTPVRLRTLSVTLSRPNFLVNPTSCAPSLATESRLTGTATLPPTPDATQLVSTPLTLAGCEKLAFSPTFASASNSKTASRANGASLQVTLTPHSHQANLKEIDTVLPPQLVSRQSTLIKACLAAQFAANPEGCPSASKVATATLTTPLLPGVLSGHGYLVSHGGAAFPDLDFVLQGDGVTLIQESHTNIKNAITSSSFPALPDAPFTSFKANFPVGPDSLLAANGDLCTQTVTARKRVLLRRHGHAVRRKGHLVYRTRKVKRQFALKLVMPTTLVGQNGARHTQNTPIEVLGCGKSAVRGERVLRPRVRVRARTAYITIAVPSAGRVSVRAPDLRGVRRRMRKAGEVTLVAPLSQAGLRALGKQASLRVRVRVAFTPATQGSGGFAASATAVFRRG